MTPLAALALWVECGQDPTAFWGLTWREVQAVLAGWQERLRHEHNDRAWLAVHVAAFGRAKKIPRLREVTIRKASGRPRMSGAELEAAARAWFAAGPVNREG